MNGYVFASIATVTTIATTSSLSSASVKQSMTNSILSPSLSHRARVGINVGIIAAVLGICFLFAAMITLKRHKQAPELNDQRFGAAEQPLSPRTPLVGHFEMKETHENLGEEQSIYELA